MNMPEDPSSVPHGDGERPIPPVEAAWSQMERKLDLAGGGGAPGQPAMEHAGGKVVLGSRIRLFAPWVGAAVAVFFIVTVTKTGFDGNEYSKSKDGKVVPATTAPGGRSFGGGSGGSGGAAGDAGMVRAGGQLADTAEVANVSRERAEDSGEMVRGDKEKGGVGGGIMKIDKVTKGAGKKMVGGGMERTEDGRQTAGVGGETVAVGKETMANAKSRHVLHAVSPALLHPRLAIPIASGDSLLRVAAAKHFKAPVKIASSQLAARYRRIPRFSAGITFKQSLPMPGQQYNSFSTDGNSHVYSDYIPAVFVRAAINKRSYLQAAFGFRSPQYTRSIMVGNEDLGSSTVPGYTAYLEFERSDLKKLFYNELELTYHYQVADRWRAGVGIQYAFLSGGTIENRTILHPANPALPDTVYAVHRIGIGHPTGWYAMANRRAEWRGILEMEYCFTRWVIGLRYQQAMQSFYFVNGTASAETITNSSISIRGSYTLWQHR